MAGFSREVARRIFAEELRSSNLSFRDGEDQHQYAPQYLLTPTGARCNRVFLVGTLTERDNIGDETEYWRGRMVDPTGSILVYAGQYQPEAAQKLASIEPPAFAAVVGKPNLYQTEDGNVIISLRAEAIQRVDEATRDQWILDTARLTLDRLKAFENAAPASGAFSTAENAGPSPDLDIGRARLQSNTDNKHYRKMVVRAMEVLRADLDHSQKGKNSEASMSELTAPLKTAADQSKARSEISRKPKPKASTAKETSLSGFRDQGEQNDIETIPLFKKS